ncbi:MAG: hypothetical protein ABI175_03975 [Polyangiales bacterium]
MPHRRIIGSLIAVGILACAAGCKSKSDAPAPTATPTAPTTSQTQASVTSASPGVTASSVAAAGTSTGLGMGAPRPRYLRRQKPEKVEASSIFDDKKTHEKHPAIDAFDGDYKTAWTEGAATDGEGEWLEGSFAAPKKIWGIVVDTGIVRTKPATAGASGDLFTQNAHAKKLRLQLDGADAFTREVAADEASIAWDGIDRSVSKVRVVADAVWPGTKWKDFGITELSLLVDGTTFPTVPESMVQTEVDAANVDESAPAAAKILGRFGVQPPTSQLEGRKAKVSLQKASLVDGAGKERLLVVSLRGEPDEAGLCDEDVWIVFLGTIDDRLLGLGSDWISTKTKGDAPLTVEFTKLHAADVDDAVATWSSCTETVTKSCAGLRAWSISRGFVQRLVDVTSDEAPSIGDTVAPRAITATGLTLAFDAKAHVYR